MQRIIEALKKRIENIGYDNVVFHEKNEDCIYFKASLNQDEVFIKAIIDDELMFDDWDIYESSNGQIWTLQN